MYFDSLSDFVHMGGHALYVWLAYGVTLLALLLSTIGLVMAKKRQHQRLRWQFQLEQQADATPSTQPSEEKIEHES